MTPEQFSRETAIHNEQVRLLAACLNIIAAGLVVTGIISPFTTVGMKIAAGVPIDGQALALMLVWVATAIVRHSLGSLTLRLIRP